MNDGITALQILLGLFFFASGGSKIAGVKPMVDNFDHWQLPQWFRPIVGYVEIIGALGLLVGLLVRWVAPLAALWLCAVMLGALATHARIRDTPIHFRRAARAPRYMPDSRCPSL